MQTTTWQVLHSRVFWGISWLFVCWTLRGGPTKSRADSATELIVMSTVLRHYRVTYRRGSASNSSSVVSNSITRKGLIKLKFTSFEPFSKGGGATFSDPIKTHKITVIGVEVWLWRCNRGILMHLKYNASHNYQPFPPPKPNLKCAIAHSFRRI